MKKLVVFTGAGISAESGLKTFRGGDGLWEGSRVEDVATPEAWMKDPERVQHFYNIRRKSCIEAKPNSAHYALVNLEQHYDVHIITQNIDDLHEKAGSTNILHLHGEIRKAQSSLHPNLIYFVDGDTIRVGEKCEKGSQLRPHVVWFGEPVPNMNAAEKICDDADILVIIGTSLQVYPAANLLYAVSDKCKIYLIDPLADTYAVPSGTCTISRSATEGLPILMKLLAK